MAERPQVVDSDWSWLADTYWYVPVESLLALRLDTSENTLAWVVDQTVWHVTGYRTGYFWGTCVSLLRNAGEEAPERGPGSKPMSLSMLGSITPEGRVHLTFLSSLSGLATIGIGRAVPHQHGWSFEMQMSTGDRSRTAHWAYMVQTRPGEPSWDSLPGVGLSVPEMLEGTEAPQAPAVQATNGPEVLNWVRREHTQAETMLEIKKRYVVDEQDRRVAVQIDLETFARIEEVLEDVALARLITESQEEPALDLEATQEYYNSLDKAS